MKRDTFTAQMFPGELIIDNFAGGGGTSTGLEQAFGRPVDIAINHNAEALAMHAVNHPHTMHLCESVWDVDPIKVTHNQPVGLVWLSPDCKHFSKAKGGKPVEKKIRGLAWVTLRWAAKCKPRCIMLENVEEFKTWGPLQIDADGSARPDPSKKGKTFDSFVRQLRGLGYVVDWRELRACDYGAPTIRRRFFLVARRDGLAITWPTPTHGDPKSKAVMAGKLLPWRTAAECIDWSIPCPSIFERTRPLAEATLRRIAKGVIRYVQDAEEPFIVNISHTGRGDGGKVRATDEPLSTIVSKAEHVLVSPTIVSVTHQGGDRTEDAREPFKTITGAHRGEKALAVATMVQTGYGEREGQAPRALDIDKPLGTVVGGAAKHALVAAFLAQHNTSPDGRVNPGRAASAPVSTITASGSQQGLVAAQLIGVGGRAGQSRPRSAGEPTATLTAKADTGLTVAHLVHMGHGEGKDGNKRFSHGIRDVANPLNTVTASGVTAGLVTSNLIKLRGTNVGQPTDEPLHTISAQGTHHAEVRAFLLSYYGSETDSDSLRAPARTVTSRDRFGLVTIHGQDYQIVDIGLRMLAPRELYRAQGFPADYIIGDDPAQGLTLTKSAQVRMCGNSVCPPLSAALARANFKHEQQIYGAAA